MKPLALHQLEEFPFLRIKAEDLPILFDVFSEEQRGAYIQMMNTNKVTNAIQPISPREAP